MPVVKRIALMLLASLLPLGCVSTPQEASRASYPLTIYDDGSGVWIPARRSSTGEGRLPQADRLAYVADGPHPIALRQLPPQATLPDLSAMVPLRDKGRIEKPIPEAAAERLRAEALLLPPAAQVQRADLATGSGPDRGSSGSGIVSLDYTECCGGGGNVPADSELAVGRHYLIAVVNVAFEIYDKVSGDSVFGPVTFASFFADTPNCGNVFDPNVIYDESAGRFILGIDANGKDYCIATAAESSELEPLDWNWDRYSFPTDVGRKFFDYPHAGVGEDAIYIGANMFGRRFFSEGRVWAVNKAELYAGSASVAVVTQSTGGESTPQPMNLHGWDQGTWPQGGPHYILTDGPYNGADYGVWAWTDPFGADQLVNQGTVDLGAATNVSASLPIDAPQLGGNPQLDSNDWRVQDAEYRNGDIWMVNTISCNPGDGAVNCVRWAQVDPELMIVVDAGVYASPGEYRIFADLAANHCDDMAVGYTKTSSSMHPAVFVSGRESTDDPGQLQNEVLVKAGEIRYTSFQSGTTHRWGDYTAMTVDPDGLTFWYMGQYSKDTGTSSGRWGNYIDSFTFAGCTVNAGIEPGKATYISPTYAATGVSTDANLTWIAGKDALSHKVYFGADAGFSLKAILDAGVTEYDPGPLTAGTTYQWRVDEVNGTNITSGDTWSFTTEGSPAPEPTLVPSSTNEGKTWTAIVTDTNSAALFGAWSLPGGACADNVCTLSGIPKKQGSVDFEASDGTVVTVLKP